MPYSVIEDPTDNHSGYYIDGIDIVANDQEVAGVETEQSQDGVESTTVFYAGDAELEIERYDDGKKRALEIEGSNDFVDFEFEFDIKASDDWGIAFEFENENNEAADY